MPGAGDLMEAVTLTTRKLQVMVRVPDELRPLWDRRWRMTETEWLTCEDPLRMLEWLRGYCAKGLAPRRLSQGQNRLLRLFACACLRQVWDQLTDPRSRNAVEVAERYAQGLAGEEEMDRAWNESLLPDRALWQSGPEFARNPLLVMTGYVVIANSVSWVGNVPRRMAEAGVTPATQAALLREVFSNVVHPVELPNGPGVKCPDCMGWGYVRSSIPYSDSEPCATCGSCKVIPGPCPWLTWNDGLVPKMAQAIRQDRAWHLLPELSDALLDAGCSVEHPLIEHLRSPGPHVLGCWAVDLLAGE